MQRDIQKITAQNHPYAMFFQSLSERYLGRKAPLLNLELWHRHLLFMASGIFVNLIMQNPPIIWYEVITIFIFGRQSFFAVKSASSYRAESIIISILHISCPIFAIKAYFTFLWDVKLRPNTSKVWSTLVRNFVIKSIRTLSINCIFINFVFISVCESSLENIKEISQT